jgi:hypothetical protein
MHVTGKQVPVSILACNLPELDCQLSWHG